MRSIEILDRDDHLVARVRTDGKTGEIEVIRPELAPWVTALFTRPIAAGPNFETILEPWSPEAIRHLIEHDLPMRSFSVREKAQR